MTQAAARPAAKKDRVGCDPAPRAPARRRQRGNRPEPQRHEVGDALVSRPEQPALDPAHARRIDGERESWRVLAQAVIEGRHQLLGPRDVEAVAGSSAECGNGGWRPLGRRDGCHDAIVDSEQPIARRSKQGAEQPIVVHVIAAQIEGPLAGRGTVLLDPRDTVSLEPAHQVIAHGEPEKLESSVAVLSGSPRNQHGACHGGRGCGSSVGHRVRRMSHARGLR
jgi:hypothetical protein